MRTMAVVLALVVTSLALAQSLRTGTKTSAETLVAYHAQASATATLKDDVTAAFKALWDACQQNAFHPIGLPVLCLDLTSVETGVAKWEVWWPLADAVDPAGPPPTTQFKTKLAPAVPVAYTYYTGDPWQVGDTLLKLQAWATNQGLAPSSRARAFIYLDPIERDDRNPVIECQVELEQ